MYSQQQGQGFGQQMGGMPGGMPQGQYPQQQPYGMGGMGAMGGMGMGQGMMGMGGMPMGGMGMGGQGGMMPQPKPDTTMRKIFVGGLPYHTDDAGLRDYFSKYGEIEEAVVIMDRATGKSKGYGFVCLSSPHPIPLFTNCPCFLFYGDLRACFCMFLFDLSHEGVARSFRTRVCDPGLARYYASALGSHNIHMHACIVLLTLHTRKMPSPLRRRFILLARFHSLPIY